MGLEDNSDLPKEETRGRWEKVETWRWSSRTEFGNREDWEGAVYRNTATGESITREYDTFLGRYCPPRGD